MLLEKTPISFQFQNPILFGFSRLKLIENKKCSNKNLMMKIGNIIVSEKSQPIRNNFYTKSIDPMLKRISDIIHEEQYHLTWKKILIIGCSAGGNVALRSLFKKIIVPHLPIIVAIHHNPSFSFITPFEMSNGLKQYVNTIVNGESILGSKMYFLPGDHEVVFSTMTTSMRINKVNAKQRFRPDINKAFTSISTHYRNNAVGIILSGMLDDGAEGAKTLMLNKGELLIQEPTSALFKEMPNAAQKMVPMVKPMSIQSIADRINKLSKEDLIIEPMKKFFLG